MTDRDQIIAIAKLDGKTLVKPLLESDNQRRWMWWGDDWSFLPNYLNSRDDIIAVIEKESNEVKTDIGEWLFMKAGTPFWLYMTEARLLCQAYLEIKKEWKK